LFEKVKLEALTAIHHSLLRAGQEWFGEVWMHHASLPSTGLRPGFATAAIPVMAGFLLCFEWAGITLALETRPLVALAA